MVTIRYQLERGVQLALSSWRRLGLKQGAQERLEVRRTGTVGDCPDGSDRGRRSAAAVPGGGSRSEEKMSFRAMKWAFAGLVERVWLFDLTGSSGFPNVLFGQCERRAARSRRSHEPPADPQRQAEDVRV